MIAKYPFFTNAYKIYFYGVYLYIEIIHPDRMT